MNTREFGILLLFLSTVLISCSENQSRYSGSMEAQESYEDTKLSLEEQEKQNPVEFISIDGTYRKNLIGEFVFEGTISNTATVATFKDVVLRFRYYSKTKTLLGKENIAIYEFFPPGSTKKFKAKSFGFKGSKSVGWDLNSATPVD